MFICLVVTGTMEFYDFPFSWEWNIHPNSRTPSFFRGVGVPTTNQFFFMLFFHVSYQVLDGRNRGDSAHLLLDPAKPGVEKLRYGSIPINTAY